MDSNSGTFSVRSETKEKFDTLIKRALKENKSTSKEKLLEDINKQKPTDSEEEESKKVLLEKFLRSSSSGNVDGSVTFIKPPIPKPRKKNADKIERESSSSKGTFEILSPKMFKKGQNAKIGSQASSSNATYPIKKLQNNEIDEEIGHLLLHNSPTTSKIVICSTKDIIEKGETENLTDKTTESSRMIKTQNLEKGKPENIELQEIKRDNTVETICETKPKPARRTTRKLKGKSRNIQQEDCDAKEREQDDSGKIVEVVIHKTDRIDLNAFIIHPVVKVHLVNINTGEYFNKSDKNRSVVFFYENDDNDYIMPVMTTYYNLQENRTFCPMWEEAILFNEDCNYLINQNLIIFFEILDFLPMYVDINSVQKSSNNGWINVAFAFLKPVGKNNALNINKKLRLQLYYPGKVTEKCDSKKCRVWMWWNKKKCKKYPSTLYVTVKDVISPKKVVETFRSKTPLQREEISNLGTEKGNSEGNEVEGITFKKWSRPDSKNFKLPTKCVAELPTSGDGCFVLKFSNNGLYLAAAVKIQEIYVIILYCVDNFEEISKFSGHQKLVHSINWSNDDTLLITASSDNTVAIWDVPKRLFLQILPHPSYVYSSGISFDNHVATGCYDKIIRIWINRSDITKYDLCQELENHNGYITSLCFNNCSTFLYSADSLGSIVEWKRDDDNEFGFNRSIDILDVRGCIINEIRLFPNEKKMLVHCRNSSLRIISVPNSCVLQWLLGAKNTRVQTFCSVSHCGRYVTAGNENGLIIVWSAKTGKEVTVYNLCQKLPTPIHCARFHTKENMIAMSHYGHEAPILIYRCEDTDEDQQGINENEAHNNKRFEHGAAKINNAATKLQLKEILQKMDNILM